MVSVCLPSDALLQHLPSYLGFSFLGHGVSLHGCSSKAQLLLLTLDEGYLLTATLPNLQRGIAPLGPPAPTQPPLLGRQVAPPSHCPWPWAWAKTQLQLVQSLSRVRLFATPWTVAHQAPPPMGFSRQDTGVGCHFLLQGIFPTQGSNPGLPHYRQMLCPLSHQGSPQQWDSQREKELSHEKL